jgi:ribosomal protein S18 acetylase RimI-like enzyme
VPILLSVVAVHSVPAEETFPLRQAVLRPHQRVEELAQPDDGDPDAGSFAAVDEAGQVVGTGIVRRRPPPWSADQPGWQVRGMAVDPGCRGQGIGSALLRVILDHIAHHGGGRAWCNARVPARGLYERAGFAAVGEPFDMELIGPHIRMARTVPS